MTQILRYNLPFYMLTLALIIGAVLLASFTSLPWYLLTGLWVFVGFAAFWSIMSLLASYYIYDRSGLTRYDWIGEWFPEHPRRLANIHSGLDESSLPLRSSFPRSEMQVLDIYDPKVMTENSIERARKSETPPVAARRVDFRNLPFPLNSFEAVFLIFAAHEIRNRKLRVRFFGELRRVLDERGKILLVEHLRDAWNFAAFGPGCFHFLSRAEWLHAARENHFQILRESSKTPFVRVFLLEKGQ